MATSQLDQAQRSPADPVPDPAGSVWLPLAWTAFVVAALLLLPVLPLSTWGVVIPMAALVLAATTGRFARGLSWLRGRVDVWDLAAVLGLYAAVVALYRLAFVVFTPQRVLGLFLAFASALVLGVAGPVAYTIWLRRRPLRSLGVGVHNLRPTLLLAVLLGGFQFVIMFRGYTLPAPVDWVPLLVLSLTVGLFEAIFFRGFVQGRLEHSFGTAPAVAGAAALYALYHIGYGMGGAEIVFLFGLGVIYAIAYRLVGNILVMWPLLTPLGALFNNLEAGDIVLPWASIAGFGDVLAVMAVVVWLAHRHERRMQLAQPAAPWRPDDHGQISVLIRIPTQLSPSRTRPQGWGIPIGVGAGAGIGLPPTGS